jgi:hypothetical protein
MDFCVTPCFVLASEGVMGMAVRSTERSFRDVEMMLPERERGH